LKQERAPRKATAAERGSVAERLGSRFEDFLEGEGLLEESQAVAVKRVLAFQISEAMEEQGLTKTAMARRMKTSRASLDRLLDPHHPSVTLLTLERAARALGKQVWVEIA
jgi:antitoxin HicB